MTKPIPDKAEVVLEYPDKFYSGTFERSSRFDAHVDGTGISLLLDRGGGAETRKSIHMHIHFALFADILRDLAQTVSAMPADDALHRDGLCEGAKALYESLVAAADADHKVADNHSSNAEHCARKAQEYGAKARATVDPGVRSALEAVVREFERKARDATVAGRSSFQ